MDAIGNSTRISRAESINNEVVKQQMGVGGSILDDIDIRQVLWHVHFQKMENKMTS